MGCVSSSRAGHSTKRLHEWYKTTTNCSLREITRDAIKFREDEVLNYFIDRSTNAAVESLNSKIKSFRTQPKGISDLPCFMYRLYKIFVEDNQLFRI